MHVFRVNEILCFSVRSLQARRRVQKWSIDMPSEWFTPFLPVVGVLIGWLLNELGARLRARGEVRRRLGEAISTLLALRQELNQLLAKWNTHRELFKPVDIGRFEEHRKRSSQEFPSFAPDIISDDKVKESVKVASGVDPVMGYRLQSQIASIKVMLGVDLADAMQNSDAYIRGLSLIEAGHELHSKFLDKTLLRMSLYMGPIIWYRVRKELQRQAELSNKITEASKAVLEPLLESMRVEAVSGVAPKAAKRGGGIRGNNEDGQS